MRELPVYAYVKAPELDGVHVGSHPVVVVGAGLTGLTLALDLARRGVRVTVLDDDNTVGVRGLASRGMVWARRTLDILERLGVARAVAEKGVRWDVGRVLCRDVCVASFTLQEQTDLRHNGFVNLQQYYLEAFLVDALQREPLAELRWLNCVQDVQQTDDGVTLHVQTPDGVYVCKAQWVVACDGAHSRVREAQGVRPQVFDQTEDRWIIIDVVLRDVQWPEERWTWLDARSNHGRAVWRHKMADDTWRLDFQLRPDEDPAAAGSDAAMRQRVWDLLGERVEFDIAWHGVWAYRHECLETFRTARVLFAGDAAHLVAPFGARGGNGGIQDADNLAWKLALLLRGDAGETLLESYDIERRDAALENIRQARRSARFVYPGNDQSVVLWRDAIMALAARHDVAARMVNTGRLSAPADYPDSILAQHACPGGGTALPNVVLHRNSELSLHDLLGPWFTALVFADALPADARKDDALLSWVGVAAHCDAHGRLALARQLGVQMQGEVWLVRPDQYVLCHWAQDRVPTELAAWVRAVLAMDAPSAHACTAPIARRRGSHVAAAAR